MSILDHAEGSLKIKLLTILLFVVLLSYVGQVILAEKVYLDDPDNDSNNPSHVGFLEIKRIEVDQDSIIIVANSTPSASNWIGIKYYIIFIDVNMDGKTDFSLLYYSGVEYKLYRFNDSCYYTGEFWSSEISDFNGKVVEEDATGKTIFQIGHVISGKVRLKVAALLYNPSIGLYCSDLVPNSPLDVSENMITYKKPWDEIFKYPDVEVVISQEDTQPAYNPLLDWIIRNILILIIVIALAIIVTIVFIIKRRKTPK
ncbi:MAG: hypothetical protein ACTSV7_04605 [Candidatus Baldrarchaeia archaeon]